ncbi:MAG: hypothetical protein QG656_1690, partial [Candidatus Hydrogenedentes bacterium]|nr:hypothetical protein [Candidatus Hydrogenedentota bacterium]
WCEDDWHSSGYVGAPVDGSAWLYTPRGLYRVIRGGGWSYTANACRSANRGVSSPSTAAQDIGFRIAR